jgi:hypothetical protein
VFKRAHLLHLCGRARLDSPAGTRPLLAMLLPSAQEPFERLSRAQLLDVRCRWCSVRVVLLGFAPSATAARGMGGGGRTGACFAVAVAACCKS